MLMNLIDKCAEIYLKKKDTDKHLALMNDVKYKDSGIKILPNEEHIAPLTGICTPEEFIEKYGSCGTSTMNRLVTDLHNVMNDILWIKESNNANTSWAIDFVDSLNTLSTSL